MPTKSKKPAEPPRQESLSPPPTEINPYTVLNVGTTATEADIRSAYRKLALKWHPDKHRQNAAEAHSKFQEIAFAYAILGDEQRRRRYDATGSMEETEDGEFDWKEWFQEMWDGVVSGDTIREFTENYQGSEEEKGDVLQAYVDGEGSVQFIIENVMACSYEDEPRFIKLINEAITQSTVEKFPRWKKETSKNAIKARRAAAEKEAREAEELSKEIGLKKPAAAMSEGELGQLIQQRAQSRMNGLLERLEAEASSAKGKGQRGKRKEPTEEEFLTARSQMDGRKTGKKQR